MKIDSIKIKMLMLEKDINISELADLMKSSRQWLGTILDRGYATLKMVNKLAKALDVDPKEIVKLED
ncbi:helix-turn-helix transcriptional regulator [uncultured Anaerococcus sp.]|uniref:helix-turn-helix domain-containing protein n=1 Tax=uncultured Anaerococcus sp. TaxID=293428 RepID=UPI00288BC221|nr:helix-turn-helix transcriptional regulator [uncultured Anaerococcus sp.]